MTLVRVMYTRCYPCQFGQCYDPPQAHTWMDPEDAEHAGVSWPLSPEDAGKYRCACRCAGGPGGCVVQDIDPDAFGPHIRQYLTSDPLASTDSEKGPEA